MSSDHPDPATRSTSPPAGWYPHPSMADTRRYWDGERWTDHIAPQTGPSPEAMRAQAERANRENSQLVLWGVLTSLAIPFVGFVLGVVLLARNSTNDGLLVMGLSVASFVGWAYLLAGWGY